MIPDDRSDPASKIEAQVHRHLIARQDDVRGDLVTLRESGFTRAAHVAHQIPEGMARRYSPTVILLRFLDDPTS